MTTLTREPIRKQYQEVTGERKRTQPLNVVITGNGFVREICNCSSGSHFMADSNENNLCNIPTDWSSRAIHELKRIKAWDNKVINAISSDKIFHYTIREDLIVETNVPSPFIGGHR